MVGGVRIMTSKIGTNPEDVLSQQTTVLDSAAAPKPTVASEVAMTDRSGTHIGSYLLLEQIGEGGMGAVYKAQQEEPVRRKVALKLIRIGMDTSQLLARFETERQALALMDHLNIARVLDAGATTSGLPYLVME